MTKLEPTKRFFQPEISKYRFATALADYHDPTRTEIDAAVELQDEIADLTGFGVTSNLIQVPDLGHRFISQIGGRETANDSSITFYVSPDGDDVRKVLPRGTEGFLIFADGGDEPGYPADVFKVVVTSVSKVRSVGDQGFQVTITFAITAVPAEDIELPDAA